MSLNRAESSPAFQLCLAISLAPNAAESLADSIGIGNGRGIGVSIDEDEGVRLVEVEGLRQVKEGTCVIVFQIDRGGREARSPPHSCGSPTQARTGRGFRKLPALRSEAGSSRSPDHRILGEAADQANV